MEQEVIKLSVLQELFKNKHQYKVQEVSGHIGVPANHWDGVQGEYNETFIFYKHPELPEGVFMRETYHTDSYGEGKALISVEFVKGKEKTVTVFEPI